MNWYHKAIIALEQKYQDAKPHELKDFDGLLDVKGYCDNCNKKDSLIYDRTKKQWLCIECGNVEEQYSPHEMASMWDVSQQLLYYFKQLAGESDENIIRFRCNNYFAINSRGPPNCYNCAYRDGYPFNIGGDEYCKNYKPKDA